MKSEHETYFKFNNVLKTNLTNVLKLCVTLGLIPVTSKGFTCKIHVCLSTILGCLKFCSTNI